MPLWLCSHKHHASFLHIDGDQLFTHTNKHPQHWSTLPSQEGGWMSHTSNPPLGRKHMTLMPEENYWHPVMSLCQSRITTSSSMPLTFNFLQGFLAALRSSVPVSCLLIFLKFNKTKKPQVTIQLKRQTLKFNHKSYLQFLNIQYRYSSIYETPVIQKRTQSVKSHKLNIRKYCTEDFLIPSKSDSTKCAEVVALFLHHPHTTLLPHLPTSLKKPALKQVLLIEISLN